MNQPEANPSHNADAGRGLSEGLGLAPARDLVERLCLQWPETPHHRDALHLEAADEIKRLRAELVKASAAFEREQARADAAEILAETAETAERERWQAAVRTVLADWNSWDEVTAHEIRRLALRA